MLRSDRASAGNDGVGRAESRPSRIGLISLDMKQMGERSAGNPHAAFDVEGTGDVARHRAKPARQSSTLPVRGAPSNGRPYRDHEFCDLSYSAAVAAIDFRNPGLCSLAFASAGVAADGCGKQSFQSARRGRIATYGGWSVEGWADE